MFANPLYTLKDAPVFIDAAKFESERVYCSVLKPCIINDDDSPPKSLIALNLFLIPASDVSKGDEWKSRSYDLESSICITPEDTIRLVRHLYRLLGGLFDERNALSDVLRYRTVDKPRKGGEQVLPHKGKRKK